MKELCLILSHTLLFSHVNASHRPPKSKLSAPETPVTYRDQSTGERNRPCGKSPLGFLTYTPGQRRARSSQPYLGRLVRKVLISFCG